MSVDPVGTNRCRPARFATFGYALVGVTMLYLVNPNAARLPLCPLHAATGLWCPLCGATRATHAILHGDVAAGLHDNALYVVGAPFVLVGWWRWYRRRRSDVEQRSLPVALRALLVVLVVAFGVIRNLPLGSWFAPP